MKKIVLFVFCSSLIVSCTYEKGEMPVPVTSLPCNQDSVIHTIPVVMQTNNTFSPLSITILQGDTVNWSYPTGSIPHTTTCDGTGGTTIPVGGTTWDSGIMNSGSTYKKAIDVAGTYTYICTIHGISMSGTIIVKTRCH